MKRLIISLLFILLLTNIATAATIQGNIYNLELKKVTNAIITIDTNPQQTLVSKDGTYELNVPEGKYTLKAEYNSEIDEQEITIEDDSTYKLDLILLPSFEDEEDIINTTSNIDVDVINLEEEKTGFLDYILFAIVFILLIILIERLYLRG